MAGISGNEHCTMNCCTHSLAKVIPCAAAAALELKVGLHVRKLGDINFIFIFKFIFIYFKFSNYIFIF